MTDDILYSRIHVGGCVLDEEMQEWWEGFGSAKGLRTMRDYYLPRPDGTRQYLGSVHTAGKRGRVCKAWTCRATTPRGVERREYADVTFLLPPEEGSADA